MISQYWIGQIPNRPLSIQIKDEVGNDVNLSIYDTFTFKMLGTNNEEIDLSGHSIIQTRLVEGKISFVWPTNRSLFNYPGDYVLQLELGGTNKKDFTSTHTLRVRELGRSFR
jgi:hypothetical protein